MTDERDRAARAVAALDVEASLDSANALAETFENAGERIAAALDSAAQQGALSFNDMAETVLRDLARLAVGELVEAPLQSLVNSLTGSLQGGLTGTRSQNIVMNISGVTDAESYRRSEGQIVAGLARATQAGARRIG